MYTKFALTLIVNHACNLRCTYCYTGDKVRRPMALKVGQRAIERAIASLEPGGSLDLAFFGGEPLIEAQLIIDLHDYAKRLAAEREVALSLHMTTNGTLDSAAAWAVMRMPELHVSISHDGLPEMHDRHRPGREGQPSSRRVLETMTRLQDLGVAFNVITVVQPDTVDFLPGGLEYLYDRGVRRFHPSLNLWTQWRLTDGQRLKRAIAAAADFWVDRLPDVGLSWFDERAARLAGVPLGKSPRCGFGSGEIAVTPRGNLYPCERVVGADEPGNTLRLPGSLLDGGDFLGYRCDDIDSPDACLTCVLRPSCSTAVCRCSNFVRTGDVNRPDGLLCLLDQTCYLETVRALESRAALSI